MFKLQAIILVFLAACTTSYQGNTLPTQFPSVESKNLAGKTFKIPEDFREKTTILLIGYKQKAQFDLDRWIYGLLLAKLPVKFYEVPTIQGLASIASKYIDNGMKKGIPQPDWDSVITVYKGSDEIARVVGNENKNNAHVLVLNSKGMIIWKHNQGYSPRLIFELEKLIREENESN